MTAVKPLLNFQNVLTIAMGGRFGIFVDNPMDALKIQSVVDATPNVDGNYNPQPTVGGHVDLAEQIGTETIFISNYDLRNYKL